MAVGSSNPIFINGAGIAGLTAALALAKAGYSISVHEKAKRLEPHGAGIQLSPNATRVLFDLGLGDRLSALGSKPEAINIFNGLSGKRLSRLPLAATSKEDANAPYLVLHRADLHETLLKACEETPQIELNTGSEITDFENSSDRTWLSISNQAGEKKVQTDALIVADGVWSTLKQKVMQKPPAAYTGKIAWRALFDSAQVKHSEMLRSTHVWFGPKSHVVTYPIRSGQSLNIVAITDGPKVEANTQLELSATALSQTFKDWHGEFEHLFEFENIWTGWPIFECSVVSPMHQNNIALVGDAAHAMVPFAAQGAAMAIEDAAVLVDCMQRHQEIEHAFEVYSKKRCSRVARVMKTARSNGRIYHLSGLPAFCRDLSMRFTPNALLSARQNWIYDWRV